MSNSSRPNGLQPTRPLCPWYFPGKRAGVGCHFLLQEIFLTQGSNLGLPHCRQMLYRLSHQGSQEDSYQPYFHLKKLFLQREEKAPVLGGQSASEGWDVVPTLKLDLRLKVLLWRLRPKLTSRLWVALQVLATPEGKCMYIYLYKITYIWAC